MNGTNGNQNDYPENALVPYPVILAASKGDPDAMIDLLAASLYLRLCRFFPPNGFLAEIGQRQPYSVS